MSIKSRFLEIQEIWILRSLYRKKSAYFAAFHSSARYTRASRSFLMQSERTYMYYFYTGWIINVLKFYERVRAKEEQMYPWALDHKCFVIEIMGTIQIQYQIITLFKSFTWIFLLFAHTSTYNNLCNSFF